MIQEFSWIMKYMKELKVEIEFIHILHDNQSAMKIIKFTASTDKTKHLALKLQYVKEKVKKNQRSKINRVRSEQI